MSDRHGTRTCIEVDDELEAAQKRLSDLEAQVEGGNILLVEAKKNLDVMEAENKSLKEKLAEANKEIGRLSKYAPF